MRPICRRENSTIADLRSPHFNIDFISAVLDIDRVIAACAKYGVAIEINGNPWRLDLDWRWHRRGVELGCLFSINPDAHSVPEIDSSTRWSVAVARKGGVTPDRVVNALDAGAFAHWLEHRKTKHDTRSNRSAAARSRRRTASAIATSE